MPNNHFARYRRGIKRFLTALLIWCIPLGGHSDNSRRRSAEGRHKIYARMLNMVEGEEWAKLQGELRVLQPFIEEIDDLVNTVLGVETRQAIATKDKRKARAAMIGLMGNGIITLLCLSGEEKDMRNEKEKLKMAFKEYVTISPLLKKRDFKVYQQIQEKFRRADVLVATNPQAYRRTGLLIAVLLNRLLPGKAASIRTGPYRLGS